MAMGKMFVAAKGKNGGYGKGKKVGKTFKTSKVSESVKKYVKKVVNSSTETKYHDSMSIVQTSAGVNTYSEVALGAISNSSPTAGAAIFALNQFVTVNTAPSKLYNSASQSGDEFEQGTDNQDRLGDTVNISTIAIHGEIDIKQRDNNNLLVDLMVIKESECADRNDTDLISDLVPLHNTGVYDRLSFMSMGQLSKLKNLTVIKRKTMRFDTSYGLKFPFTMNVKVNKKISYIDGSGLTYNNRYWLLAWQYGGNETAPTIKLQSRMYFKDA